VAGACAASRTAPLRASASFPPRTILAGARRPSRTGMGLCRAAMGLARRGDAAVPAFVTRMIARMIASALRRLNAGVGSVRERAGRRSAARREFAELYRRHMRDLYTMPTTASATITRRGPGRARLSSRLPPLQRARRVAWTPLPVAARIAHNLAQSLPLSLARHRHRSRRASRSRTHSTEISSAAATSCLCAEGSSGCR